MQKSTGVIILYDRGLTRFAVSLSESNDAGAGSWGQELRVSIKPSPRMFCDLLTGKSRVRFSAC